VKSVPDRMLEVMDGVSSFTANELAKLLHCSYSSARVALKKAHDRGELKRDQRANGEWYYWKAAA